MIISERVQKIVYSYPTLCRVWERYKTATNEFERINYRCRIYEMSYLLADIGVISEQERQEMCSQVRGEFL